MERRRRRAKSDADGIDSSCRKKAPWSCLREPPASALTVSGGSDRRKPVESETVSAGTRKKVAVRAERTNGSERDGRDDGEHHEGELRRDVKHGSDWRWE